MGIDCEYAMLSNGGGGGSASDAVGELVLRIVWPREGEKMPLPEENPCGVPADWKPYGVEEADCDCGQAECANG